jgi:hypothetical protein
MLQFMCAYLDRQHISLKTGYSPTTRIHRIHVRPPFQQTKLLCHLFQFHLTPPYHLDLTIRRNSYVATSQTPLNNVYARAVYPKKYDGGRRQCSDR